MSNSTFETVITMVSITCCHTGCGIVFGVPQWWETKRRSDHTSWYCPNGHSQFFSVKSEAEKLREQLATAQGNLNWYQEYSERKAREVKNLERQRAALRGITTKLKKRARAGVCAWCNRSFENVARHVASKHADVDMAAD